MKEMFVGARPVEVVYLRIMKAVALGLRSVLIRLREDQIYILEAGSAPDGSNGWIASIWPEAGDPDSVGVFMEDGLRHAAAVSTERLVSCMRDLAMQDDPSVVEALNKLCDETGAGDA